MEEPREAFRIGGVEGSAAAGAELARGVLQALGIAAGEDDLGAFGACPAGGFEPDPGTAADDHDDLPEQLRAGAAGCGGHAWSVRLARAATGSRAPAISVRSALTAAR